MAGLMTVYNPSKGKRKRRNASKRRKGRMPPALARYWATHRRSGGGKRRRSSGKRRSRRNPTPFILTNARRRRNPSNGGKPLALTQSSITRFATDALTGAAGALAVDVGMGFIGPMLPPVMVGPIGYSLTKSALAFGAGIALKPMLGTRNAAKLVEGSLICTLRDTGRAFIPANIALGAYPNAGAMARGRLRAYTGARGPMMGAYTAAAGPRFAGRTGSGLLGRTGQGLLGLNGAMSRARRSY